jgi:hybrid polyketide synthase/nonribosomal peptide synthetase ACE1
LAGDAAEAQAITTAFFPTSAEQDAVDQKLWVGSIKTIVGHTEGTAGIAGVLKASLALKHATVPPNLLFESLNPKIEPFYKNVQLSTKATPWPSLPEGHPRRASVNSFGFGGANVHAILESYDPATAQRPPDPEATLFTPFVFSANTEASLRATLVGYHEYLTKVGASIPLRDLAYTLHSRRSAFQFTSTITASDMESLISKIDGVLQEDQSSAKQPSIRRAHRETDAEKANGPSILGIFTGQGAQWAGMGAALIRNSKTAKQIICKLETRLSNLPTSDRPSWSLEEELLKDASSSRMSEATISQPLCTAVQILQVDLLRAAGIKLSAVVGHSSGEIGAAYASGFLTAEDAICVAYYRGLHSHLAGHEGISGSMMAVGTSVEDAQELCDEPEFQGRVSVAAINSPVSVTLSGDQDAIEEMKIILDDEKKFARVLKVDKAYHSHHMTPCSDAYIASLAALEVKDVGQQDQHPTWFSSVFDGEDIINKRETLGSTYWNDNMVHPVLFQQAIVSAHKSMGQFTLAIEIGPHSALQGPALQTVQDLSTDALPYTSLFRRGVSGVESVADCLGYIWSYFGGDMVDLKSYDDFVSGETSTTKVVKGLPTYAWDHGDYWNESRYAKAIRLRPGPLHELLGHMTPDSNEQDLRWRHVLKPSEMPWLIGHKLQDQIVFPAAGYVASALEAAMALCKHKHVTACLIEVIDVEFGRALVFDDSSSSVEVIISMANITRVDPDTIEAHFWYHGSDGKGDAALNLLSHGKVRISIGEPFEGILPARRPTPPNLIKVPAEDFYSASRDLEYQWAGPFVGLDKLERKLGYAEGVINVIEPSDFLIHPTVIDVAFQGVLLGYSYPDDGQLWSIHVPGRVRHLSINPALCKAYAAKGPLPFVSTCDQDMLSMTGNSEVYTGDPSVENCMMQVEDMDCVPLSRATAHDDQEVFATIQWGLAQPDAEAVTLDVAAGSSEQDDLMRHLERLAAYYMRTIQKEIPADHAARKEGPYTRFLQYVDGMLDASAQESGQSFISREWENDTLEQLTSASESFNDTVEMQLLHAVAKSVLESAEATDDTDHGIDGELLRKFYKEADMLGMRHEQLVRLMKQLVHRNPSAKVLQIGSGTGTATQAILDEMASSFASYTVTDVHSEQFEYIKTLIPEHLNQTLFSTLDTRLDPVAQGLVDRSFDVVIAFLALRARPDTQESLQNIRRLLKPGGRMVVVEMLPKISPAYGFMFGALLHWWDGVPDDQCTLPVMDLAEWDSMLREAGFSGCDTIAGGSVDEDGSGDMTLFDTQAMDEKTSFLRNPLSTASLELFQPGSLIEDLIILGGKSLKTSRLILEIKSMVKWHCGQVREARSLPALRAMKMTQNTTVLSLAQLDTSVFQTLDEADWESLKAMLMNAGVLLWVTQGRRSQNPWAAMMVGLLRSIVREIPTLSYRVLDFESASEMNAHSLASSLLRFQAECKFLKDGEMHTSVENEIVVKEGGQVIIPRLVMNPNMNHRYNSHRRPIPGLARPQIENVCVESDAKTGSYQLVAGPLPTRDGNDSNSVCLEVKFSLMSAVRVGASKYLFPVWGRDTKSGNFRFGLSEVHSSIATLPEKSSIEISVAPEEEAEMFSLIVLNMLASSILRDLSAGDSVLLYEPDERIEGVVAEAAKSKGIVCTVVSTSNDPSTSATSGCKRVTIHPSTLTSVMSRMLPTKVSVFVEFQAQDSIRSTAERILSLLPFHCRRENLGTLFAIKSSQPSQSQTEIQRNLQEVVDRASNSLKQGDRKKVVLPMFSPNSLPESDDASSAFSIINWNECAEVPIRVRPIATRIVFSADKTYWLAGLSRGLGLALCEWMIRHGARHFVISSRNPQIHPAWLQEIKDVGATVKVASCDVTVREQVTSLHREICETMPAIGGVCQGSMVLVDTAIRDMTRDNFLSGTRPKVEGSLHLNELFQENTLEFFMFFSSVVSTIGRPGQANYSAANMFMASLAEQRHQKGLAASVIHIGPIYGVGYAAQSERMIYSRAAFRATGLVPTSERDFYAMFTEAVIAGRPGGFRKTGDGHIEHTVEILNGLGTLSAHHTDRPAWETEPLMSHFVRNANHADEAASSGQSKVPVKTQLAEAIDRDQVYGIIQEALLPKLYSLFQMDSLTVSKEIMTAMRLVEIGIDSLLAVEIRGWFMKTLEVNIPVLKILSGVPIHDLIVMASETIPERLVPGLTGIQAEYSERVEIPDTTGKDQPIGGSDTEMSSTKTSDKSQSASSDADSEEMVVAPAKPTSPIFYKTLRLSFSQEMFWFIWKFIDDKCALNHTAWARLSGTMHIPDLERAFATVAQQHEILRTCIVEKDGKPMQSIMNTSNLKLETKSIENEDEVRSWVDFLQDQYVYDVAQGQTVRVILLTKSPTEHFFVAGLHPLIADGISFQSLLKGIQQLYAAGPDRSDKLAVSHLRQYSDYSEKQHSDLATGAMDGDLRFWKQEFAQLPPPLPILTLSSRTTRPDLVIYKNIRARFSVSLETKTQLQMACRRHRITPFHFYLATFRALLLRYSAVGDGEDMAIGIGDANRLEDEMVDVIGPFVNFLPLRLKANSSTKFSDLLQHTREKVHSALAHSKVPFQVLLDE